MILGHLPTTRAKSPIVEHKNKYPEMRRNGLINGSVKINRIDLRGSALVAVRHVESPSCIWVELTNNITDQLTVIEPFDLKKVNFEGAAPREMVDNYYMAPREERTYSRVRVLAAVEIELGVFVRVIYIDHGDTAWVNVQCLAELPKNFEYHPWQVICLSLTDLEKVHHGYEIGNKATYWTKEDCEIFADLISEYTEFNIRVLRGSVIRNDYREPIKVEMFGLDPIEQAALMTSKKKTKGRNIACLFASRTKGKIRYIEIDDASNYPFIIGPSPSKRLDHEEAVNIPQIRLDFPENWVHKEEEDQPLKVPRSEWDRWDINQAQVPYITDTYVHKKFYDELTSSYLVIVEGTCTQSPYEFYGRFFKRIPKEFTKEEKEAYKPILAASEGATLEEQEQLGDITWSMMKADEELKDHARNLDAFYGIAENRFMMEPDLVKGWLNANTRVYAITNVPEERAMYTGEWQRVEVLDMDNFANVRYLDSGGTDTIAASNLYRLHNRHSRWHPLCAQFSLLGLCDPNPKEQNAKTFDMKRRKAFSATLRVDVPLMISVLTQPNLHRKRDRIDKPFERDNVLFAQGCRIMGENKPLLDMLFELPGEQACKRNHMQPIDIK